MPDPLLFEDAQLHLSKALGALQEVEALTDEQYNLLTLYKQQIEDELRRKVAANWRLEEESRA